MTAPGSMNGKRAVSAVVATKAAEPGYPNSADSATAAEEVKPTTAVSLPARIGISSPTIDAFLSELGCPVIEGTRGALSGEESRGRKPMLQCHVDLGPNSKSSIPRPPALPPISLDRGRPSPRSSFSGPSEYYKFPPAQSQVSSEAVAGVKTPKSAAVQTEIAVGVGNDTATSDSTAKSSGELEKPVPTEKSTVAVDPEGEGRAARLASGEEQIQQPSATPRRTRDPCRVLYATTCSCELEDEEIARVKRRAPTPPAVLPRLLLPRTFSILKRCPSCDSWFGKADSDRDRVACVMEEHWACVVHLCLTGRIEAAFADE